MMEKRRFAVLLCAEESDYVKKKYGGYFGVFVRMLAEEGEIWDVYSVAAGEFPHDDDLAAYDGFVITGSCNDAHGNDAWICELLNLLTKLDSMKKKVLGICFGHQSRKEGRGKFSRSDPDHHSIIPTRTTPLDLNEEYVEEGDVDGEGVQEQAYQYEGELNQAEEEDLIGLDTSKDLVGTWKPTTCVPPRIIVLMTKIAHRVLNTFPVFEQLVKTRTRYFSR